MVNAVYNGTECDCEITYSIPESVNTKFNHHDFVEILLIEDNVADTRLVKEIFKDFRINNKINVVEDGVDALNYLYKKGKYINARKPDIILLDVNLPKKDGMEVLYEIKSDKNLKYIPTIVLTASYDTNGIEKKYCRYINCYIVKPFYLEQYMDIVLFIKNFWLIISKLPEKVNVRLSFNFLPQLSENVPFKSYP